MKELKPVETNIHGVKIFFENTFSDTRGTFFDIIENGFNKKIYSNDIKHIYATYSKIKLVAEEITFTMKILKIFFP